MKKSTFTDLESLATHLRQDLKEKKYLLIYAYNGTGKTRLSMAFKNAGKHGDKRDTLYFNAFTEDLFTWDNDLDGDSERALKINTSSRFFLGLEELEMENRIRPFLHRYTDFDFTIEYAQGKIRFFRTLPGDADADTDGSNIKVSRGEEMIFIWCFFLAIAELAMDGAEAYQWVKYLYIDDPISSLDENNAIAVASNLAQLLKRPSVKLKIVISTHHTLFFNVCCNELGNAIKYFLLTDKETGGYILRNTGDTPFFVHVAMLEELCRAAESGALYTYHFNMLRSILEKTASFHGFTKFSACIKKDDDDPDGILYARLINLLSHGNYSLYEPREMMEENKEYFKKILQDFMDRYPFDLKYFSEVSEGAEHV